MKTLCILIARGNSKGIPRKNLVELGGIPLIAHMIKHAINSKIQADVIVSTDDKEIAEVALKYGAEVPFLRPAELALDHVTSLPVVQHAVLAMEAIRNSRYELIVYLQPTAPLCRPEDIEACVNKLIKNPSVQSVVTITPVETHPFKMKRLIDNDRIINYIDQGFEDMRPRQQLPPVYRRSGGVYVSRRDVVMNLNTLVGEPCLGVKVPPETAVDIDSIVDLELARMLLANNLNVK